MNLKKVLIISLGIVIIITLLIVAVSREQIRIPEEAAYTNFANDLRVE